MVGLCYRMPSTSFFGLDELSSSWQELINFLLHSYGEMGQRCFGKQTLGLCDCLQTDMKRVPDGLDGDGT